MRTAATRIIHLVEDIFAESALVEERDFLFDRGLWKKFFRWLEEIFILIAFREENEMVAR